MLFDLERTTGPLVFNRHHRNAPPEAIYVGRGTPYGNPHAIGDHNPATGHSYNRREVIELYEAHLRASPKLMKLVQTELRGKDLLCSCKPAPCHADVLLKIANA